jgi:2'-5' RNA ligase
MEMYRTFIAIELPESVEIQLGSLIADLQAPGDGVRWVRPENIHLTLKFLGDVPSDKIPLVAEGVEEAASPAQPFVLVLSDLGTFPNLRRPRVIWVGVHEGHDETVELQKRIEDALESRGFPREGRRFSPHITIGRVKKPPHPQSGLAERIERGSFVSDSMAVSSIAVMRSVLRPEGPIYTRLTKVEFEH